MSELRGPAHVTLVAHDVGGIGGMELQLEKLVSGALRAGIRVTVISRSLALPPHPRLSWRHVPGPRRPFSVAYPSFVALASLMLLRRRDGVVHSTGAMILNRADVCTVHYLHSGAGGTISRSRSRSLAYRLNGAVSRRLSRSVERFLYRRKRRTDCLVAVSERLAAEIAQSYPMRSGDIRVIPNGVDVERFDGARDLRDSVRAELRVHRESRVAIFVGSEWHGKGLLVAIEALRLASEWHLLVVGEGDAPAVLRQALSLGVGERVHLVGKSEHPERYLAAADAFVLPSAYETFSLVAFEAAAAGLPVLATRVGALDVILDGGGGIPIERTPHSIAAALESLEDRDRASELGRGARAVALRFDWGRVISAYLALYESLAVAR